MDVTASCSFSRPRASRCFEDDVGLIPWQHDFIALLRLDKMRKMTTSEKGPESLYQDSGTLNSRML